MRFTGTGKGLFLGGAAFGLVLMTCAGAVAISPGQEAAIDIIDEESESFAETLDDGLRKIDASDKTDEEKRKARGDFLDENLEEAKRRFGERSDVFRLVRYMLEEERLSPGQRELYGSILPDGLAKELRSRTLRILVRKAQAKAIEEQKKAEPKDAPKATPPTATVPVDRGFVPASASFDTDACVAAYRSEFGSGGFQASCLNVSFGLTGSLVDSNAVFGTGTVVSVDEKFAASVPSQIARVGFDVQWSYQLPGSGLVLDGKPYVVGGFGYATGSASSSGYATVGEDGVTKIGVTFLEFSGSSGAGTATNGWSIAATTHSANSWAVGHLGYAESFGSPGGPQWMFGVEGNIETFNTSYGALAEIYDPSQVLAGSQETSGESRNTYYGVRVSAAYSHPLTSRLTVGVGGFAVPAWRYSDANLMQYTSFGSVSQELDHQSSGVVLYGGVSANLDYRVSKNLGLNLSYEYSCLADATELHVPANPDEQPAYFYQGSVKRNFWKGGLRLDF